MMDQEIVQADDLVKDLLNTKESVFSRHNKTISGPLDLGYHTIGPAVDLRGCHFLDDVDLSFCDFEQAVNLTGCTFDRAFNKTDQSTSQSFHCNKDFTCDEAIFEGPFSINGARIEGSASFANAQFKSTQEEVDFTGVRLEVELVCNGTTFLGSVSFNALKCEGAGFFNGATFNGTVDLSFSSFGSALECKGATFIKDVQFDNLKCQELHAFPDEEYGATAFREVVSFQKLKCEGAGSFNGAIFEKDVSFAAASFGSALDCSWDEASDENTTFRGKVNMYALKCEGDGLFMGAQFRGAQATDFSYSRFGGHLSFASSSFSCPLMLEQVEVSRTLNLTAEQFQEVSLYSATIEVLALSYEEGGVRYTFPRKQANLKLHRFTFWRDREHEDLQFASSLDLRGLTFNRLMGSKQDALQFAKAQRPTVFSLDPYAQIEKYYEKVGRDSEARDIHYEGRIAIRRNAATSDEVRWTFGMMRASDLFSRMLTGYDVRTDRIFFLIIFFLLFGMLVFSVGDFTPLGEALAVKTSATSASSAAAQNLSPSKPTLMDQITYSMDRFIPIDMGFEEGFEPQKPWSKAYDAIHVIVGWLLIPLFLVLWSGLVRSRR